MGAIGIKRKPRAVRRPGVPAHVFAIRGDLVSGSPRARDHMEAVPAARVGQERDPLTVGRRPRLGPQEREAPPFRVAFAVQGLNRPRHHVGGEDLARSVVVGESLEHHAGGVDPSRRLLGLRARGHRNHPSARDRDDADFAGLLLQAAKRDLLPHERLNVLSRRRLREAEREPLPVGRPGEPRLGDERDREPLLAAALEILHPNIPETEERQLGAIGRETGFRLRRHRSEDRSRSASPLRRHRPELPFPLEVDRLSVAAPERIGHEPGGVIGERLGPARDPVDDVQVLSSRAIPEERDAVSLGRPDGTRGMPD